MARHFLCMVIITIASAPPLAAQSLVHLWAFNGDYNDTSGSGNHGTPSGNPLFVTGKFGSGISLASATLDGVDLHFGANNLPLNGTDSWSMNLWAKFSEAPGQLEYLAGFGIDDGYIDADASATRAIIAFGGATNNNFYFWGGSNDLNSGVPYGVDNQWHMYTVTYDGADLRMYKDASLVATMAKTFANAFDEVHVGNPSQWNNDFDGELDEFAIYNGALNESQVGGLFFNNDINQPVVLDPSITVNRDTGQVLFTNDSSFPIEVLGYTLRSASGSLDATAWQTIADRFDAPPGDGSIDNDPWTVFTNQSLEYSIELSEGVPGTDGGTIAIGKVIDFGSVWAKNPMEDVVIDLLLDDGMGTVKTLAATFTGNGGTPQILADYNGNGTVDAADWTHFRTATAADLSEATATEAYYGGDLDGDFDKDINDFSLFVRRYELFNGAGSFANLGSARVPEPASCLLALSLLGGGWALRRGGRAAARLSLALLALLAVASPASAALWGYYPLNGDANESTGNNTNLNLLGDASFGGSVHPGLGSALQLDGNGDGAIGPNFNKFTTNDFTVMAWAYANNTDIAWDSIVKNWGSTVGGQFHLGLGNAAANTLQNHIGTGPVTDTNPFPLGQWVHTAVVLDSMAGEHRLYMNGVEVASVAYAGTLPAGAATGLGIGVKPDDDGTTVLNNSPGFWNGRLDDVALFDVAMTDAEIMAIYQNGLQGIQADGTTVPYITLQVDRGTGMATLMNTTGGDVDLTAYQIKSPGGDLRLGEWEDLAGNSGFPTGNGSGNGWEKDGASGATQLLETYLTGSSSFASGRNIALGEIFTPGGDETLEFSYRLGNGAIVDSLVNYVGVGPVGLPGDFNNDGAVDARDYVVWRNNLNGSDEVLNGNGNNTGSSMGVVDKDDYIVWKDHYGDTAGSLQLPPTAVPEPGSAALLAFAVGGALVALSRQGSRAHV